MATRAMLAALLEQYSVRGGCEVQLESVGGVDAVKRVMEDEAFDVVFLASDVIHKLVAAGKLLAHSQMALATSSVAVAVRAGAVEPEIHTAEALRNAVLSARSIGYSTGPSGIAVLGLLETWGITEQMQGRVVQAPSGVPVGTLVAQGDVQLGFQQWSELMHVDGITVLGLLPPEIHISTTFSAAIATTSPHKLAAQELLRFLASDDTAALKRREGMEPVPR